MILSRPKKQSKEEKPWNGLRHVFTPYELRPKERKLKKCTECPALIKLGRATRCLPCQDVYKQRKDTEYRLKKVQTHL